MTDLRNIQAKDQLTLAKKEYLDRLNFQLAGVTEM
jgi:hypothetical protein